MNNLRAYILFFLCILQYVNPVWAQQDTLPDFSVTKINGSIQIQWHNPYKNIIQLNIQRSRESNKNYSTIHTATNPSSRYYKYTDKSAPHDSCYYRIFILYEATNYQFSKIKRPVETARSIELPGVEKESVIKENITVSPSKTETVKPTPIKKEEVNANAIPPQSNLSVSEEKKNFNKDSKKESQVSRKEIELKIQQHFIHSADRTKNHILSGIKPAPILNTKKTWTPSSFIYTGDDGNIIIDLPHIKTKNYSITFLKEEGRPLFRIAKIEHSPFTLDKVSFLKSGWYYFELKESGKVVERNKFLITRDN